MVSSSSVGSGQDRNGGMRSGWKLSWKGDQEGPGDDLQALFSGYTGSQPRLCEVIACDAEDTEAQRDESAHGCNSKHAVGVG